MAVLTSVFTENQHTCMDCYLNFGSHVSPVGKVKQGLVGCLFDRAEKITLNDNNLSNERKRFHIVGAQCQLTVTPSILSIIT